MELDWVLAGGTTPFTLGQQEVVTVNRWSCPVGCNRNRNRQNLDHSISVGRRI